MNRFMQTIIYKLTKIRFILTLKAPKIHRAIDTWRESTNGPKWKERSNKPLKYEIYFKLGYY